ncbi:MAG: AraC family transcriptional regulator [Desulfobacterales bacterium]|nr:AraC family transcriptional regulator [Desulfobacterales bacterium]
MSQPIFFKTDFTYPDISGDQADPPYGKLKFDIRGMDNPDSFFKLLHIKPGMYLSVYNHPPAHIPAMGFEVNNAPVSFSFLVSGACYHRIRGQGFSKNTEFNLASGTNSVTSLHDITGDMSFNPEIPIICVDLKIDRRLLHAYLHERMDRLPSEMSGLFDPGRQVYATFPLCREMTATTMEIINPPAYTGVTQALFYESRALNLLALQLEHLTGPEGACLSCGTRETGPRGADLDRLHEARRILVSDLKNPPTISALARQCGINEFKLKKEFKQVFNTTIFTHLQQVKMEKAWHLLKEDSRSVTEAANEVGYTNVSHFSAAFRKQFLINPGTLKKAGALGHRPVPPEPDSHRRTIA